jgi:hypothetical protein
MLVGFGEAYNQRTPERLYARHGSAARAQIAVRVRFTRLNNVTLAASMRQLRAWRWLFEEEDVGGGC